MSINVLPPQVANQIAAGEVVERPSAVVKELLENSFDAHATKVLVEIEGGGSKRILIRDNGDGIIKDELALALKRHATSKIANISDLDNLLSMGFRGEALASIAAVSRLVLTSKPKDQEMAYAVKVEGIGQEAVITPAAHPNGTSIEICDLFFNTPARRRFLRSEKTEFLQIDETFKRLALSRPEVDLVLKNNGKTIYNLKPGLDEVSLNKRLGAIMGNSFIDEAKYINNKLTDYTLKGYISLKETNAPLQYFFVNKRIVKDRTIVHAIKEAFNSVLDKTGSVPYVLFLECSPSLVDINVHPQKYEVRFQESRFVHDFIENSVINIINRAQQIIPESFDDTINSNTDHNYQPFTSLKYKEKNQSEFIAKIDKQQVNQIFAKDFNGENTSFINSKTDSITSNDTVNQKDNISSSYGSNSISTNNNSSGFGNVNSKASNSKTDSKYNKIFGGNRNSTGSINTQYSNNQLTKPNYQGSIRQQLNAMDNVSGIGNRNDFLQDARKSTTQTYSPTIENNNVDEKLRENAQIAPTINEQNTKSGVTQTFNFGDDSSLQKATNLEKEDTEQLDKIKNIVLEPWLNDNMDSNNEGLYKICLLEKGKFALLTAQGTALVVNLEDLAYHFFVADFNENLHKNYYIESSPLLLSMNLPYDEENYKKLVNLSQIGFVVNNQKNNISLSAVPLCMRNTNIEQLTTKILSKVSVDSGIREITKVLIDTLYEQKKTSIFSLPMAQRLVSRVDYPKFWEENLCGKYKVLSLEEVFTH